MSTETAECVKCKTEIRTDAERCKSCGYEPSPGILGGIIMWIALTTGTTFTAITFAALIVIFDGFPIIDGVTVATFTGAIAAVCFGIVYAGVSSIKRGPTDQPNTSDTDSATIKESWNDGSERGEAAAERVNNLGPAIVNALPSWTWTVGILLGAVLNLSVFITATQNSETGMMVGVFGGGLLLFGSITTDAYRLNWSNDEFQFRWWFWATLGFIPLIGWIFGLAWVARKRQKTGSTV